MRTKKRFLNLVAIAMLGFFVLHMIIPLDAIASRNNMQGEKQKNFFDTFPSLPQGIQDHFQPGVPQFYFHHLSDPVNALNGNLFLAYQDLYVLSRGFPLEVSRTYNSRSTARGILGYGWWSSLDVRLERVSNGLIQILDWDGSSKIFTTASSAQNELRENIYRPAFPSTHYVIQNPDGTFRR